MGLVVNEVMVVEESGKLMAFHVPTTGFYEIEPLHRRILDMVEERGEVAPEAFGNGLGSALGADQLAISRALRDLTDMQMLVPAQLRGSPLTRLADQPPISKASVGNVVIHVAHTCNLNCSYCYAESGKYGGSEQLMTNDTALRYVDWLFDTNPDAETLGITFFGGEPLINFRAVQRAARYAQQRAAKTGQTLRFSITTNGTLVTDKVARFLADIGASVTLSLDGDQETNDLVRPFHSGRGSYDYILKRVQPLLDHCNVAVRVTLTRHNLDAWSIVNHIMGLGFRQVGISPVDSGDARFDLSPADYELLLTGMVRLADKYQEEALAGRMFGFSNIHNVVKAVHTGHNKDYPCGAAINMLAGDPDGNLHACHRFVGQKEFRLGDLDNGIDESKYFPLLERMHLDNRTDCSSCWARYLCSGGCHYINDLFEGDVQRTHGDHCDWLRAWYYKGLSVYARISSGNPSFIQNTMDPGYISS